MSSSLSRLQVIPQEARGRVSKKSRTDWHDSIQKIKGRSKLCGFHSLHATTELTGTSRNSLKIFEIISLKSLTYSVLYDII